MLILEWATIRYPLLSMIVDNHLGKNYAWLDMGYMFSVRNIDKYIYKGQSWLSTIINITDLGLDVNGRLILIVSLSIYQKYQKIQFLVLTIVGCMIRHLQ